MTRDYAKKRRGRGLNTRYKSTPRRRGNQGARVSSTASSKSLKLWLVVGIALMAFIVLMSYLKSRGAQQMPVPLAVNETVVVEEEEGPQTPRFDFYKILPDMQIEVEVFDDRLEDTEGLAVVYVLQIGSFRDFDDADSLKASLALLGFEAHIETTGTQAGTQWHRVRVGPYATRRDADRERRRLQDDQVESLLVQVTLDESESGA